MVLQLGCRCDISASVVADSSFELPHQFRAVWHKAKAEIGLGGDEELVPHTLRHTCASRLVRGGIDIRRVQMWLGHQTLQMTMRYSHLATHDLDVCVPVLERR